MKNLALLILFLSIPLVGDLWAQETNWKDFATFTLDCDGLIPGQTIPFNDPDFSFIAGFGSNVGGPNVWGQIERTVIFEFTDFDDNVLSNVNFTSIISEWEEFELNHTHLAGLPEGSPIFVNMIVCYKFVNDEAGTIHNLSFIANEEEICEGTFSVVGDEFCCEIKRVLCFYTPECELFSLGISVWNNNELIAEIIGNPDDFSYQWTFEDLDTGETGAAGSSQVITVDYCRTAIYCVTVTDLSNGCTATHCLTYAPPLDCEPCLIAVPGGLTSHTDIFGNLILSWDPTSGAVSYLVEIVYNDPACCPELNDDTTIRRFSTEGTEVKYSNKNGEWPYCFSWKVKAYCDGVSGSSESEKKCELFSGGRYAENGVHSDKYMGLNELNIFPNPTNSNAIIEVKNVTGSAVVFNVYTLDGQLISSEAVKNNLPSQTLRKNIGDNLEKGMYIIQVVSENRRFSKRLVVIK